MKNALIILGWGITLFLTNPELHGQTSGDDCACCSYDHQLFDFWIGRWTVYNDTTLIGSNTIRKTNRKCLIWESWQGAKGSRGQSINYYDAQDKKWHQTWVSDKGWILHLSGNWDGKAMVMQSADDQPDWSGKPSRHIIRWQPMESGHIIQTWTVSYDNGETWQELFKGRYERVD